MTPPSVKSSSPHATRLCNLYRAKPDFNPRAFLYDLFSVPITSIEYEVSLVLITYSDGSKLYIDRRSLRARSPHLFLPNAEPSE